MPRGEDLHWDPDLLSRSVDGSRVLDIAFTPMPVRLRNELISRAYGDVAESMAALLGTGDATWAAFGQWASHTIGGFLTLPVPVLGHLIAKAFADGNRDVFADIGRGHIVFLDTVGAALGSGGDLEQAWERCERRLRRRLFSPPGDPGGGTEDEFWVSLDDPRSQPAGPHHNRLLVLGFRAYFRALQTAPGEDRSRLILAGNCLLALHEQKLLGLALSVGFRSWVRTLTTPWASFETRHDWRHREPGTLRIRIENAWIALASRYLTGVELPTGTVRSGRAVPAGDDPIVVTRFPVRDNDSGRRAIEDLSDEVLLGKLFTHLGVDGERARCWNDLLDRMAFIAALFAEHQRAEWWFDDDAVVRPDPWSDLDAALADQVRAMDRTVPPAPVEDPPSPLTDAELDALRRLPTHLPLGDAEDLPLEEVNQEPNTDRTAAIRQDVAQRLSLACAPGGLLDPATCRGARRTFSRWSTLWFMALVFRSLPDSYAAAAGVHVLGTVSDLATDPFRRVGETAFFVIDLMESDRGWTDDRMEADGAALRSVQGVRVMHSLGAARLLDRDWDSDAHGLPFNAEDVVGTALAFGSSVLEMTDLLGADLDEGRRNDITRFWLGIGFLLGAPHEALTVPDGAGRRPLDHREALSLSRAIRRRHQARSLDGVRLTEALVEGVADGLPRGLGWLAPGMTGALGDPRATQMLLVGAGRDRTRAALVTSVLTLLLRIRPLRPLVRTAVQGLGRRWVRPFLDQGRTRPYRRPPTQRDLSRREAEERVPDLWPAGCSVPREPS